MTPSPPNRPTILVVTAHPDDETVFGGGTIPYYAQRRDVRVVLLNLVTRNADGSHPLTGVGRFAPAHAIRVAAGILSGRIHLRATNAIGRIRDALCILVRWEKALVDRTQALRNAVDVLAGRAVASGSFDGGNYVSGNVTLLEGGLVDTGPGDPDPAVSWSGREGGPAWGASAAISRITPGFGNLEGESEGRRAAARVVARAIRSQRPDVVVCVHDMRGDYGHSNHSAAAIATLDGATLAAAADLAGAPWTVKKVYLRGRPDDNDPDVVGSDPRVTAGPTGLFHDHLEDDISPGRSARRVAQEALAHHFTEGPFDVLTARQRDAVFDGYPSEWWTLLRSTVGPDTTHDFRVDGDVTGTAYSGWARGGFPGEPGG